MLLFENVHIVDRKIRSEDFHNVFSVSTVTFVVEMYDYLSIKGPKKIIKMHTY